MKNKNQRNDEKYFFNCYNFIQKLFSLLVTRIYVYEYTMYEAYRNDGSASVR